jgi:hypothetical protein
MRITELTGYKKDPLYNILQNSTDAWQLENNLEDGGFKKYIIGTGLYSSVLSRPDLNYVVKIFNNDPGYETYLTYIMKYQNNPHVPKLRGKVISVGPSFKVVRLERLEPYSYKPNQQKSLVMIDDYVDAYTIYGNKAKRHLSYQFPYPEMIPLLHDILQHSGLDMHSGNTMFRGDVPVITDPLSGFSSK